MIKRITALTALGVLATGLSITSHADTQPLFQQGGELLLQTSLFTTHYSNDPDHHEKQRLINLEWTFAEKDNINIQRPAGSDWRDEIRWLVGGATFKNSFNQQSTYLYAGGRYNYFENETTRAYAKLTAGLLHGYRGEYRDKIPFNRFGVAPAILPAFGVEHHRVNLEMIPFGTAGVMFNIGYVFR
ncbi:hypothetical protein [Nitrincola schmidtii]|uniref:hypothetical protein n=1 Tax=Nitrincola schmidtii TaxID=1730894 RepID=UPI00197EF440|nr:hypothetical protein [Nitrincola schmidtii]